MRLLVDMNLSPDWEKFLVEAGIETRHWSALGAADASDHEIMTYAESQDYIVLTHDLDFGAILAATAGAKPSVVQLRMDDISPNASGALVVEALRQMEPELDAGALLTIGPSKARVRLLPLLSR